MAQAQRRDRWRPFLPLIAPLLILGMVVGILLAPQQRDDRDLSRNSSDPNEVTVENRPSEKHPDSTSKPNDWIALPMSDLAPGASIPGWQVEQGSFQVVDWNGIRVLEFGPEPMTEGLLRQLSRFNYGGVRALMGGEAHRRVAPRFSVSLEGQRPYALRAAPTHQRLELVTPSEIMLSTVDW